MSLKNPFAGVELSEILPALPALPTLPALKPPKKKRGRGRPKAEDRAIVPADWPTIRRMWCRGYNPERIAEKFGVSSRAIGHHLKRSIIPWMRREAVQCREDELARLSEIERTAWEQFESEAPREVVKQIRDALDKEGSKQTLRNLRRKYKGHESEWLSVILDCIDKRARILGHYAPTGINVRLEQELRLAGSTVAEVSGAMIDRLVERIEEQRKYLEQVRAVEGNEGEGLDFDMRVSGNGNGEILEPVAVERRTNGDNDN